MVNMIDNNTSALLGLALDAAALRHQAIAHNIANANTPGYQVMGLRFEQSLADARDAIREAPASQRVDMAPYRSAFEFVEAGDMGSGQVAIDIEVAKLSENTLYQQTLLKALNRYMSMIGTAINDGKR